MRRPGPGLRHGEDGGCGSSNLVNFSFRLTCCSSLSFLFLSHQLFFFFCNCPPFAPCAGYGSVIQMYPGEGPARAGMESFGFPAHFHDTLHDFPICRVNALLAGTLDTAAKSLSAGRVRLFFYKTVVLKLFFVSAALPATASKVLLNS